jgi:hypothetical protein
MSRQVHNETEPNLINRPNLEEYFIQTGFYDLLPLAWQLANDFGYGENEMIEAVCKVKISSCSIRRRKTEPPGSKRFLRRNCRKPEAIFLLLR